MTAAFLPDDEPEGAGMTWLDVSRALDAVPPSIPYETRLTALQTKLKFMRAEFVPPTRVVTCAGKIRFEWHDADGKVICEMDGVECTLRIVDVFTREKVKRSAVFSVTTEVVTFGRQAGEAQTERTASPGASG